MYVYICVYIYIYKKASLLHMVKVWSFFSSLGKSPESQGGVANFRTSAFFLDVFYPNKTGKSKK